MPKSRAGNTAAPPPVPVPVPVRTISWPEQYWSLTAPDYPITPSWSPQECVDAGNAMAKRFIDDRRFAEEYLRIVRAHKSPFYKGKDLTSIYQVLIQRAYPDAEYTLFNAHDFANVHHATWLVILEAFACLVDYNPHGDWGDPPLFNGQPGVTHGEPYKPSTPRAKPRNVHIDHFHTVPNDMGCYAINSTDIQAPAIDPGDD
jgi:hypothetical protein